MDIWKILKIKPTTDKKAIKKAYKELLKTTRPDDDQDAFMQLREAYEKALEYEEYEEDEEDLVPELSEAEIAQILRKREFDAKLNEWTKEAFNAVHDFSKARDAAFWKKFLNESIAYELNFFKACKERMRNICLEGSEVFLSDEVWKVIDEFFDFSVNAVVMAQCNNEDSIRNNNKKLQLNEMIDFEAFGNVENSDFQNFCSTYKLLIEKLPFYEEDEEPAKDYSDELMALDVEYLPFECIKLALNFKGYQDDEIAGRIEKLTDKYGDSDYIQLLLAEYYIYSKAVTKAKKLLQELYKRVPLKNYPFIYQMAVCCKKVSMYLESYMLIKQLTWLNPQSFMYDMAQELFEMAKSEYDNKLEKGEEISDYEHIAMSRLYIRTYSERKKTGIILDRVRDTGSWEYNVAAVLHLYNEYELDKAKACFEILDNYPKENLSSLDLLEYQEFKARYLLQYKKFGECIDKCNELLEEFPLSYTMLMLRSYADNNKAHSNAHGRDLEWLGNRMPQRPEAVLFLACASGLEDNYYGDACRLIESYKDICYAEYMFYKLRSMKRKNYAEYADSIISFCEFINNNEVTAPDYSGFNIVSLRTVYMDMAGTAGMLREIDSVKFKKFFVMLEDMKNSKFNKPEKYVNLSLLYFNCDMYNKLYSIIKDTDLKSIDNAAEYTNIIRYLISCYSSANRIDEIEKLVTEIDFSKIESKEGKRVVYNQLSFEFCNNNLFEKAEEYALKALEINNGKTSLYTALINVYNEWGKQELSKNEKCIEIIDEVLSVCGRVGDMSNIDNVNKYKALCYARLGRNDEAERAMADCFKYTKRELIKNEYYSDYSFLYECMGDYDKAYDYLMKYEQQNPDSNRNFGNKVAIKLKAGKFTDAAEIFIDNVEEYDKSFLIYAAHCYYLENLTHNMEFVREIYNTLPALMDKYKEAGIGYNYISMAEASYIVGDMESYAHYRELSEQAEWDNAREKNLNMTKLELWQMMYNGEFQKVQDIVNADDFYMIDDDIEFRTLQRELDKMARKGII